LSGGWKNSKAPPHDIDNRELNPMRSKLVATAVLAAALSVLPTPVSHAEVRANPCDVRVPPDGCWRGVWVFRRDVGHFSFFPVLLHPRPTEPFVWWMP
jgi:hypothetical protein